MKTDASCGDTSAAGSWSEPTRGWASSAGCWFVMNICSPSIVPFSTSPVSGLHSDGIYETRSSNIVGATFRLLQMTDDGRVRGYTYPFSLRVSSGDNKQRDAPQAAAFED